MRAHTSTRWRRLIPLASAWALLLIIETLGQVAMKMAGVKVGAFELNAQSIHAALSTPWLWLALACYLGQFAVWMNILEKSALSAAFPTSAPSIGVTCHASLSPPENFHPANRDPVSRAS